MTIQEGLVAHLEADSGVAALVGDRIYGGRLPQNPTYPCILYFMVADERSMAHDGPTGLAEPLIQVESWATAYLGAIQLADAVRTALIGFIGNMGTVPVRGVDQGVQIDFYEQEPNVHRVVQDYTIRYRDVA